jgi:hypothetical protein
MSSSNRPVKSSSSPVLSVSGQQGPAAAANQMPGQRGCLPGMRGPGPWGRMVDGIASRLAFFPPTPPSYTVEEHRDATGQLYIQPVERCVAFPASTTSASVLCFMSCIAAKQQVNHVVRACDSTAEQGKCWTRFCPNSSSKLHAVHDRATYLYSQLVVFSLMAVCL